MWKNAFAKDEFHHRRRRVRAAMEAARINVLLVFHPMNIQCLIGSQAKSD
ncbi:MAG: hypothetical protein OEQ29_20460 [Alphaproteobacteria bacterium]|nr:hypothetical protein [Alphaproteobacteria bacterium]